MVKLWHSHRMQTNFVYGAILSPSSKSINKQAAADHLSGLSQAAARLEVFEAAQAGTRSRNFDLYAACTFLRLMGDVQIIVLKFKS